MGKKKNIKDISHKRDDWNDGDEPTYYDFIQMGPMEEEILYEFHFDIQKFKKYLKNKELDQQNDIKNGR